MALTFKALTPSLWPKVEKLFGPRGACGGCWCMFWRLKKGEKLSHVKGETNRKRFRKLVLERKAHGVLAFEKDEPVGWCSFDRRVDYDRLNRAPSLACDDAENIWSIPCFYIKPGHRKKGVGSALLIQALAALKKQKAKIVEGYPSKPSKNMPDIPAAFAWTGTLPMFEKAGFTLVGDPMAGKLRMRKTL